VVSRRDVHDLYKQLEAIAKEIGKWRPNRGRGVPPLLWTLFTFERRS